MDYQKLRQALNGPDARSFGFRFVDHVTINRDNGRVVGGMLQDVPAAHAAWYFCRCAMGMFKEIKLGAQYEGEHDHFNMINNLCRTIAAQYNLDSPSLLVQQIPQVKLEAARCNLDWDERLERPDLIEYIRFGG